jgi:hypothetical protein
METAIMGLLLAVALINLAPVVMVVSARRVEVMYGVRIESPDLAILLRHRAILFGIVGALILASVFVAGLRLPAMLAAAVSMLSFVVLALLVGGYGAAIRRVVVMDVIGLALLLAAAVVASW